MFWWFSLKIKNIIKYSQMDNQGSELKTKIETLTTHIITTQKKHKEATGDFSILIEVIATASKWICNAVRKAELLNIVGLAGFI
jgi:fructose-1,6-bisphosphatase I